MTTTAMNATGKAPKCVVSVCMIERRKKPSGVERNISETPCSAMNIASVVISGDSLTMRIRNPLRKPMNAATASASPMPSDEEPGSALFAGEERQDHDDQTGERSDRKVDAAGQQDDQLSGTDKGERAGEEKDAVDDCGRSGICR